MPVDNSQGERQTVHPTMTYIGVDPGRGGGIAWIRGIQVWAKLMPATERDLLDLFECLGGKIDHPPAFAALEHVWSIPGQGGAFKFGKSVGHLEMALTAARIPFDQVLPKAWQRVLGIAYPPGATDVEKKNITKRRAQQLFPLIPVTHAIADALLIAEYCRRVRGTNGQEESRNAETVKEAREAGAHTEARHQRKATGGSQGKGEGRQDSAKGTTPAGAARHGRRARQGAR